MSREKSRSLKREELYQIVWTMRLAEAATRFGMTVELLRRICGLLEVPLPMAGHWRRVKTPRRRALPRLPKSAPTEVALKQQGGRTVVDSASVPSGQILKGKPIVPSGAHPLVERAAKFYAYPPLGPHGRMKPSSSSAPNLRVTEALKERALSLADKLFKALEMLGCDLQWRGNIEVQTPYGTLKVSLQEELISIEREPTAEEKQRIWWSDQKYFIEQASGHLLVQIESYVYNIKEQRKWRDENAHRFELRADEIAAGIVAYSKAMVDELDRQAVLKKQREEEWDRRRREEVARELEKRRVDMLNENLTAWRRADEIRRFAGELEAAHTARYGPIDAQSEVNEWIEWMRNHADQIDPLAS